VSVWNFLKEFSNNNWNEQSLKATKKVKRQFFGRRPVSDRSQTSSTAENVDFTGDLVLSQKDGPQTYQSVREISRHSSVVC